jgi:L-cysteine/cystine lyase
MTFEEARAQFPVLERYAYLNAGTTGPLARATVEALEEQAERDLREGRSGKAYFERVLALREEARQGFADVLDVDPSQIAVVDSTSRACGTVLAGLGLTAEDEVITTDQEHFGLTGPVYASGARVVVAEGSEDGIVGAVTPRTKLIATSHVLWTTGRRLDLHRIKRESGLPMLADGAQSAGAIAVDVGALDFYTVSAQKWLCAPEPTGALYVRDPDSVRIAAPSSFSQTSYERTGAFVPKEGAARFDSGWIGMPTLVGLIAALGTHPEWRYSRAAETAASCAALLGERVEVVTPPGHSTLVSFRPARDPVELVQQLEERGVLVRELPGRNLVRVSCGWWTSADDLERLVDGLDLRG